MSTMTLPDTATARLELQHAVKELQQASNSLAEVDATWRASLLRALEQGHGPRELAEVAGITHARISQIRAASGDGQVPASAGDGDPVTYLRYRTSIRTDALLEHLTCEQRRNAQIVAARDALVGHRDLMALTGLSRDRVYRILREHDAAS